MYILGSATSDQLFCVTCKVRPLWQRAQHPSYPILCSTRNLMLASGWAAVQSHKWIPYLRWLSCFQGHPHTLTGSNLLPRGATHLEGKCFALAPRTTRIYQIPRGRSHSASHMRTHRVVGKTLATSHALRGGSLYDVVAYVEFPYALKTLFLSEALILLLPGSPLCVT